ncbi:hypothetical protein MLD38_006203 [Melastoma candidum]|uniref:Uncharacterized protein n=1 Tax=Melastoma candidum TaxID=119954 RepID=A0ACB9RNC5_9MYRT|nr:hypothetical protein MLD38_006203 [Melastoma candidum]
MMKALVGKNFTLTHRHDKDDNTPLDFLSRSAPKNPEVLWFLANATTDDPPGRPFTGPSATILICNLADTGFQRCGAAPGQEVHPNLLTLKTEDKETVVSILAAVASMPLRDSSANEFADSRDPALLAKNKSPWVDFKVANDELRRNGEQWMKDTSNSCMLAATLISTMVFVGAFTVPWGNMNIGTPVLLGHKSFMIFTSKRPWALQLCDSHTHVPAHPELAVLPDRLPQVAAAEIHHRPHLPVPVIGVHAGVIQDTTVHTHGQQVQVDSDPDRRVVLSPDRVIRHPAAPPFLGHD